MNVLDVYDVQGIILCFRNTKMNKTSFPQKAYGLVVDSGKCTSTYMIQFFVYGRKKYFVG